LTIGKAKQNAVFISTPCRATAQSRGETFLHRSMLIER
jgi:hypothetical protein